MWLSPEFQIYLTREFQRLKEEELKQIGWNAKRELAKINYHIHTDAIKKNLIPSVITDKQKLNIYANEADVLNIALFGITAKEWKEQNLDLKGNIRDYATINELICMSNLENLNSVWINEKIEQKLRLIKLNEIAISQMTILQEVTRKKIINS